MAGYSSPELFAIAIQLAIVLLIVRRSYAMTKGVQYSLTRLAVLPAVILFLWALSELEQVLLTPWALPYLTVLDVGVLIGSAVAFTPIAERMTSVERDTSGGGSYRIGFSITALFLAAFLLRLILEVALFPAALEFGAPPGGYPPEGQQVAIGLVYALFSVSVGLLVGRSLGVYRRWERSARSSLRPGPS
ncbi:MAG: hypothetical protein L3K09_03465 [Thermoplasmata archaeon]|nr:hypothetical protein [Thermoplasmata archaeon]